MQIFRSFVLKRAIVELKSIAARFRESLRGAANRLRLPFRRAGDVRLSVRRGRDAAVRFAENLAGRLKAMDEERKARYKRQAVSLLVIGCIAGGTAAATAAAAKWGYVARDGRAVRPSFIINTSSTGAILEKAGVSLAKDDLVQARTESSGNIDVTVKTAKHVKVEADGKTQPVLLHYGDTVSDALQKAGVAVGENDAVNVLRMAKVWDGMTIKVLRKYTVSVTADGKTVRSPVWEGSVSSALQQLSVALGPEDSPDVNPDAAVAEGMSIKVSRVTYRDVTATEPIPFQTVTQKDSTLAAGKKSVKTDGQNGVKTVVSRQKLSDGKVVQSTVVKTEITKQPVSRVVAVGTKRIRSASAAARADGTLIDRNGRPVRYKKLLRGRCTAYYAGTTTATGLPAAYGRVAVNPNVIPYGTRLYICSPDGRLVYGYAVAADTGGAAMSNAILADLYYPSYEQCVRVGSRTMNVYLLG